MIRPLLVATLVFFGAREAMGAERGYSVTDFDKIDVFGPVRVIVEAGRGATARASGTQDGIDRLSVQVRSRRLYIRPVKTRWTGSPRAGETGIVTVRITTHSLRDVVVTGTAQTEVDVLRGATVSLISSGSATITVKRVEADRAAFSLDGSGAIRAGGKAQIATISNKGTGLIDTSVMVASDLTLASSSAGETRAFANRSAKITAWGQGSVTVEGPASCTVTNPAGTIVSCGTARR